MDTEPLRAKHHVLKLFGVETASVPGTTCLVAREHCIPGGRLDLVVHCGNTGTLLVEIKTSAEVAEHQWTDYPAWLQKQHSALGCVLVAIDQPDDFPEQDWAFRSWEHVSTELRSWASKWWHEGRQIDGVMTLAFCSAVEQNLLGLHTEGLNTVSTGRYLGRWLEGEENGKRGWR